MAEFEHGPALINAPALGGQSVTPSDTDDLPFACRGICVGVAGDVKVTHWDGDVVTWPALVAGVIHPIAARRIWDTGTTATTIVAAR